MYKYNLVWTIWAITISLEQSSQSLELWQSIVGFVRLYRSLLGLWFGSLLSYFSSSSWSSFAWTNSCVNSWLAVSCASLPCRNLGIGPCRNLDPVARRNLDPVAGTNLDSVCRQNCQSLLESAGVYSRAINLYARELLFVSCRRECLWKWITRHSVDSNQIGLVPSLYQWMFSIYLILYLFIYLFNYFDNIRAQKMIWHWISIN